MVACSHLIECSNTEVPSLFGTRDRFCGRQYFHGQGAGGSGGGVQAVMRAMGSDGEWQMKLHSRTCHSPPAVQLGS